MQEMGEERQSFFSAVMAELSRRKVLKTVGAYAVAVFVLLQLMDAAVEPLPDLAALPKADAEEDESELEAEA